MKKLFLLIVTMTMMLSGCQKYDVAIDDINSRLDKIENAQIASLQEQINSITTTLPQLENTDKELKGYIENLQLSYSSLQQAVEAVNAEIDEVKNSLQGDIATNKSELLAQLETVKNDLQNQLTQIGNTLHTLQTKDTELEKRIEELEKQVEQLPGMSGSIAWINATFATLEQHNALASEVATIKGQIEAINKSISDLEIRLNEKVANDIAAAVATLNADIQQKASEITAAYTEAISSAKREITAAYTAALSSAIANVENSLKQWVNEQLSGYLTIAAAEAKLAALQSAITEGDTALQEELAKLAKTLEDTEKSITEAYTKAIEDAIATNNGVIDTKIATEIATVNARIDEEVAIINARISTLEQRLGLVEDKIATINEQMNNINNSIEALNNTDKELKEYIESLQATANNLQEQINSTNTKIGNLKTELKGDISTAKAEVLAQLDALRTELEGELAQITTAIAALQAKDAELEKKITDLQNYVDTELSKTEDWAEATFATLEQYNSLANEVATIKTQITAINQSIADLETRLNEKIATDIAAAVATLNADIQQKVKDITDAYTSAINTAKNEITAAYTAAIESAISALETSMQSWVNEQLKGYYTISEIDALLSALEQEFNTKLDAQKAYLESLINALSEELKGMIANNSTLITALRSDVTTLQGTSAELATKIAENATAIATNAQNIIANAEAISANGENIEANTSKIAENKSAIEENAALIAENKRAIAALKSSTDSAIAKNATDIATNAENIAKNAELIAKNATAINNNAEAIAHNTADIAQLQQDLATTKTEITEAYKSAISAAITTLDGELRGEIATQVSALNTRIDNEVATINAAIDALTARVTTLENEVDAIQQQISDILQDIANMKDDIANLMKRIQSVTYIPKYSDGKATMNYQTKTTEFDFLVSPKSTVKDIAANWQSILSMKAVYTITRAVSFVDMPIISFEADETNGVVTITVSGENLNEEFFTGTQEASAALHISDGNNSIVSAGIQILSKIDIPDLALKKYLVDNYDYNGNGEISIAEAENITMVNCSGKGVADLTGLESCTNLVTLDCSNNNITKIELPNLAQLETVTCNDCPIELMNFNGCSSLQYLNLQDATTNAIIGNKLHINRYNQAKSLTIDVSNTTLEHIFVCRSEILAYLDVSKNTQLKHLEVYVNPNLKSIDVSTLVNLEILDLGDCDLTNLDVSKNLVLTELYVTNNKLSTIDVSKNKQLKVLKCKGNQISNLNVSNNDKLETLILEDNKLSAINVSNNTALTHLNINNNAEISMVDVKTNKALTNLYCNGLAIGELNIVNNTALTKLECNSNPNLTTLTCNNAFDFTTTHISINKGLKIISANGSVLTPSEGDLITVNLGTGVVFSTSSNGSFTIVSASETSTRWYDAKTWCSNYGANWSFPSLNSLKSIYKNKSTINSTLSANGFTTLSANYWSSTDDVGDEAVDSRYYAYRLSFSDGNSSSGSKNVSSKVRAVLSF